jgi:hypothetical protein
MSPTLSSILRNLSNLKDTIDEGMNPKHALRSYTSNVQQQQTGCLRSVATIYYSINRITAMKLAIAVTSVNM